ncbi:MAG: hypothetical protein CMO81_04820 [Waddliaceae bacterium]|nr:hypothetical protein [Waddliaceae bacterium]
MLDEETLTKIRNALKRTLALKMTRSTYWEIQNIVLTALNADKEKATQLLDSLLIGQPRGKLATGPQLDLLNSIINEFCIPLRVAKDVFERAEFLNTIASDIMAHQNRPVFVNRVRRIDGEEFQFMTDTESCLQLLKHMVGRLTELKKSDKTKATLEASAGTIKEFKELVQALAGK